MKDKLIAGILWACIIGLFIFCLTGCNTLKKAENKVLANIESVKRVRTTTDALFPCSNDTILDFIHDSSIVERIQTNIDTLTVNDTTYVHYFDTVYKARTITRNSIVTDTRLTNRLQDSVTALRLERSEFNGRLLTEQKATAEQYKQKKNWIYYAVFSGFITILLIAIIVLLVLKKLPIKL